jgi:general secretion pathway protein M
MASALPALRAPRPITQRLAAPLARWLAAKSPGERGLVVALAVIAAIVVLWVALWQPLTRSIEAMRSAQAANAERLAAARRMVEEGAALARTTPAPAPADLHAELDRALAQHDLRGAVTQLSWQDDRARVVLAAVAFDRLIAALESLQRDAGLRVVEAAFAARVEPGWVRAELTLTR